MSNALETQGVIFKVGDTTSPFGFSAIGEITSFTGPGGSASVIDVSHLGSTAREKIMGLPDEGQFSFEGNYLTGDTNGQQALQADRAARTLRRFQISLTDSPATLVEFNGYVLEFSLSGGVDAVIAYSCTIEITGAVDWDVT